jgi:ribosomal protein L32
MNDQHSTTSRERLRMHLVQALTRTESDEVEHHLRAALDEWKGQPPTPLQECPICGNVGLPERIQQHRCSTQNIDQY